MRKMKSIFSPEVKTVTKVLVTGMAYECKDGRFAALAWDTADPMVKRVKTYHANMEAARNATKAQAIELLAGRPYKPAPVYSRTRYTLNLWS